MLLRGNVFLNGETRKKVQRTLQYLRRTDASKYLIFQFYADGMLDEITEDELYAQMQNHGIYDKIIEKTDAP